MHFLLLSENEFFHETKCNGMTSFMEFMKTVDPGEVGGKVRDNEIKQTQAKHEVEGDPVSTS